MTHALCHVAALLIAAGPGPDEAAAPVPAAPAPAACTDAGLRLRADALETRDAQLQAWETTLKAREHAIDGYKDRVKEQLGALTKRIAELEKKLSIGEGARQARNERLTALADTISTLSAKKAAPMLATTDPALVGDLLIRLGADRSAALLALMPANRAARFLEQVGQGSPAPGAETAKP